MDLQDLTFNKEGDLYVCEFEATGPFNIKISRTNVSGAYGALSVQQSLTGEDYVSPFRCLRHGLLWPIWILRYRTSLPVCTSELRAGQK